MITQKLALFLEPLVARGVVLRADGDELIVRDPDGVLTASDVATLRSVKPILLAYLRDGDDAAQPDPAHAAPVLAEGEAEELMRADGVPMPAIYRDGKRWYPPKTLGAFGKALAEKRLPSSQDSSREGS